MEPTGKLLALKWNPSRLDMLVGKLGIFPEALTLLPL
jgi:hypothetical protein